MNKGFTPRCIPRAVKDTQKCASFRHFRNKNNPSFLRKLRAGGGSYPAFFLRSRFASCARQPPFTLHFSFRNDKKTRKNTSLLRNSAEKNAG